TSAKTATRKFVFATFAALAVFARATAQQPTFRSGAQLTIVDVTVTDKDGRPIEGLTASDFALTEDGVPQTISMVAFQRADSADAAALPPLPPTTPRTQGP